MSETKVSGSLAAMFFSSSISSILLGILFYVRKQLPFLTVYEAAGAWSGIGLYSYLIWIVLWIIGYLVLRGKKEAGSLRTWVLVFVLSVVIGTLIIVSNLNWASLFE